MKHVYWIIPEVLCGRTGPEEEPWDARELRAGGIDCIVSLSDDPIDASEITAAGIEHEQMHMPEGRIRTSDEARVFRRAARSFIRYVDACRRLGKSVMVHCLWGNDRTGIMLATYLMTREGLSAEEAIRMLRRDRPDALRLPGYEETVYSFERHLHENRRK